MNLPEGKNLVGSFHHPLAVFADIDRSRGRVGGRGKHSGSDEFPVGCAVPATGEREADARIADAGDEYLTAAKLNGDTLSDVE